MPATPYTPESVYQTHKKAIYQSFIRKNQSGEDAEELCGQTFLQMVKNWDQRKSEESTPFWLRAIARSVLKNKVRNDKTQKRVAPVMDIAGFEIPLEELDSSQNLDHKRRVETLIACIAKLPQRMNEIVKFRMYHGCSVKRTAEIVGIPEGTVKSCLHTAFNKLKECVLRKLGRR